VKPRIDRRAPQLGQDTEEILLELGYSWEDLQSLKNEKSSCDSIEPLAAQEKEPGEGMIEEITESLYKIEIPLPNNLLKSINSYVIRAGRRSLIIDTGMNLEECMNAMQASLRELQVDLRQTDFFITHFHADHIGLVSNLITDRSVVYFNRPESEIIETIVSGIFFRDLMNFTCISGFPENEAQELPYFRPGYDTQLRGPFPFRFLEDGDPLKIGDYQFQCVRTPGHSRGHTCLYEPHKKLLISGDHLLNDITPSIQSRFDKENPLKQYFSSLDRVYELDVELVLPGHKGVFRNCRERIRELKDHHQERADEIVSILREGSKSPYHVASEMTWNVNCDSWDGFPAIQKFFATGETTAHLKYLEEMGLIRKEMQGERMLYSSARTEDSVCVPVR